jgi:hypothetical protein
MESYLNEFTGYKANYQLNGTQFNYRLDMNKAFSSGASLENWNAGFPAGQAWTGLAFMYYLYVLL